MTGKHHDLSGPAGSTRLRALVTRYRLPMASLAVVSFLGALLEAFFLVIITGIAMALVAHKEVVGPVAGHSISIRLAIALGAIVLLVRLAFSLIGVRISTRLSAEVTNDQRRLLSHAYLQASWSVQQDEPSGRLQELLTTFVQRVNNTIMTLTQAIVALLSLLAFLSTGFVVDLVSTGAVLLALGAVGAVLAPIRRRIRRRSGVSAQAGLDFTNAVSELGSLGLEMQTFGVRGRFARSIDDLTEATTQTQRRVQDLQQSLAPIYMTLAYAAVLAGVGVLAVVGFDNLAAIGAVMLLMLRSLSYGQQLAAASGSLSANVPFLEQIASTVQRYHDAPASTGSAIPASVTPIEAHDVDFAYRGGRLALTDASFRVEHGEIVGVIGPSGAGKSTLAQLLLGLQDPTRGSIEADGLDLRTVDRVWWSQQVAFVAQDARLLTGTVAQNIRFFRDDIDEAALRQAALRANILADIERLPHGFDTHLGERGSQLSGGQRQRLSIARALAGSPALLVLDEPTSALDGTSEALIRDTLANLKGSATVVVIAHRMSTLDMCDRIMVIESGQITAFDSPANLHADSAFFQTAMAVAGLRPERAG